MELDEALIQISHIRRQMAQTGTFRGYRALTTAFSGLVALVAAYFQESSLPYPMEHVIRYTAIWVAAALIGALAVTVELIVRYRHSTSETQRQLTLLAAEQFVPAMLAGAAVTAVIARTAHEEAWMLPGLWSIIFAMGIFASRQFLPHKVFYGGVFYLLAGVVLLTVFRGFYALDPWAMGATFAVGQFINAGVLYMALERKHVQAKE